MARPRCSGGIFPEIPAREFEKLLGSGHPSRQLGSGAGIA
jgi:hypothetical protein